MLVLVLMLILFISCLTQSVHKPSIWINHGNNIDGAMVLICSCYYRWRMCVYVIVMTDQNFLFAINVCECLQTNREREIRLV